MEIKTCTSCGKELPINEFHKKRKNGEEYRSECKSCVTKHTNEWRVNNIDRERELNRLSAARRRMRLAKNGGKISMKEKRFLLCNCNYKCAYCGAKLSGLNFDHYAPIISGGKTELGNIVPCCTECNRLKGSNDPEVWILEKFDKETLFRIRKILNLRPIRFYFM